MTRTETNLMPLRAAIAAIQAVSDANASDTDWLAATRPILQTLIANDAWLPDSHAAAHPQFYQQYALHIDPAKRFSISSFVWGPGQGTPIHNHTIAGWVGVLRGAELCQRYTADGLHTVGAELRLNAGQLDAVSASDPSIGDVHTVRNGCDNAVSVSIHMYRGDIAATSRSVFSNGTIKPFQSSYSGQPLL